MSISRRAFVVSLGASLGFFAMGKWAFAQRVPDEHGIDPFVTKNEQPQDEAYLLGYEWSSDERFIDIFEP